MERRDTDDILQALDRAAAEGRRSAIATVVRVKGSAYRREGARMLVREDGGLTCMLSGGCLEPEVAEVARRVIASGQPQLRHYDLAEDVVWGLGLGCGGTVDVLVEPAAGNDILTEWLAVLRHGAAAVLATPLPERRAPVALTRRVLVTMAGIRGTTGDAGLDARIGDAARALLAAPAPRAETRALAGASGDVFFDVSGPPPELVILGAGHDAIPIAQQAARLGWAVVVVDARAAFTNAERFPGARLIVAAPNDFAAQVALSPRSHVLVMNHHLERDAAALAFAVASDAAWVGVLGPRSRYEKLVALLHEQGHAIDPDRLARVRNPVGLDIGAEGADEVALAIVAGLVAERRGFKGGLLDGLSGRIHDPER